MVNISRKTYERNGVETIVDSDGILRLNEKHREKLDHKNLRMTAVKYFSDHRKRRYEWLDEPKKIEQNLRKELAAKVIMDCRKVAAHKF